MSVNLCGRYGVPELTLAGHGVPEVTLAVFCFALSSNVNCSINSFVSFVVDTCTLLLEPPLHSIDFYHDSIYPAICNYHINTST